MSAVDEAKALLTLVPPGTWRFEEVGASPDDPLAVIGALRLPDGRNALSPQAESASMFVTLPATAAFIVGVTAVLPKLVAELEALSVPAAAATAEFETLGEFIKQKE